MASIDNQYEHGRIPIRPLKYSNREFAKTNELMVDYGEDDSTYKIYIADDTDPKKVYDLTQHIIDVILPNAKVSINQMVIDIEGVEDPVALTDILNVVWKNYVFMENINGFRYDRDIEKVLDPTAKSAILRNSDGTVVLPVTLADNIIDSQGKTFAERLKATSRTGTAVINIPCIVDNQIEFEFTYPFENYKEFIDVRFNSKNATFSSSACYTIEPEYEPDGSYTIGILTLNDQDVINSLEIGDSVDLLFIYNSADSTDSELEYVSGSNVAVGSLPTNRLAQKSDSYELNSSSHVATSKAVYNLYNKLVEDEMLGNSITIRRDASESNELIEFQLKASESQPAVVDIPLRTDKLSTVKFKISRPSSGSSAILPIYFPDGSALTRGLSKNKTIRFMIDVVGTENRSAWIINGCVNETKVTRLVHTCSDHETVISYAGLKYNLGATINVYRNGVRLFEDINYSIDTGNQRITLFYRADDTETIVFEAIY